jgi:hypothetical protein
MMSDDTWARVSLRIRSPRLTPHEIGQLMGEPNVNQSGDLWATDLTRDSGVALDEQLRAAKEYLRDREAVLEAIPEADIGLLIGWTPRSPQDGIILDTELIGLLSTVRCHVLLDTYLD